jgi:hypothetical protein
MTSAMAVSFKTGFPAPSANPDCVGAGTNLRPDGFGGQVSLPTPWARKPRPYKNRLLATGERVLTAGEGNERRRT